MKVLYCRDIGFICEHIIQSESEEEVLEKAAEHVLTEHDVEVTPEMADQMRELIQDE